MLKGIPFSGNGILLSLKGMEFVVKGTPFRAEAGKETPTWEPFRLLVGEYSLVEPRTC